MSKLRKTGIDVLGDVPWGSHFCNFYETKQDLLDITVPYFKAGLENKEFCMWVVSNSEPINVEEATQALKQAIPDLDRHLSEGNIEIHDEPDWYLKENVFNLERVINAWNTNLKRALALGYEGIRVAGDTFWLNEKHWKDFYAYEKELNNFIINLPITLLCTYPLSQSKAADVLDVAHAHQFTIARRQGEWEVIESAGLMHAQAEIKRLTESKLRVKEQSRKPLAILSYGLAMLNVVAATAILILMKINLADATPYTSVFLCAVIFSTWFCGVGPGLVSIVLSAIAFDYFFLPPIYTFAIEPSQYSRIVLFMIPSLFIVWVSANQKKVTQSLRQTSNTLEGTVQKLSQTNTALHEEIAERKKSELLILKEKELSNEIIDSIPGVFLLHDQDRKFIRWNKHFEVISGYTAEEIPLLYTASNFYDEEDKKMKLDNIFQQTYATGTSTYELTLRMKDGSKSSYYFNSRLINYEGNPCILCTGIDITERKQAEETLQLSYEEIRRLTNHLQKIREEERKTIAREIHDELGQQLTAIKMDVVWIDKKTPEETIAIKNKLKNIIGLLDGSNQSVRKILSELRTGILEGLSLMEALKWQSWQFTERTGIPVEITTTEKTIELPEEIATSIFRVYQESLTNIMRYAQANKVLTSLSISDNTILFTIEDDGKGFDTTTVQHSESFGILGMKERVASVKGKFNLVSTQGKGTSISISIPYNS